MMMLPLATLEDAVAAEDADAADDADVADVVARLPVTVPS
jgi:hypothetical protein